MLKKVATIKRFEYSPLDKELKAKSDIAEKQYQRLNRVYEFDKKEDEKSQQLISILNQI